MRITFMMKKKYHNYWNEHGEYLLNQWILLCLLRNSEMCEYYKIKCRREQVFFLLGTVSKSNSIFSNRIFFSKSSLVLGQVVFEGVLSGWSGGSNPGLKGNPCAELAPMSLRWPPARGAGMTTRMTRIPAGPGFRCALEAACGDVRNPLLRPLCPMSAVWTDFFSLLEV